MSGTAVGSSVCPGSVRVGVLIPAARPARRAGCPRAPAWWRRRAARGPPPSRSGTRARRRRCRRACPNGVCWPQKQTRVQRESIGMARLSPRPAARQADSIAAASRRPTHSAAAGPGAVEPGGHVAGRRRSRRRAPRPGRRARARCGGRPPRRRGAPRPSGRRCSSRRSPCSRSRGRRTRAQAPTGTRRPPRSWSTRSTFTLGVDRVEGAARVLRCPSLAEAAAQAVVGQVGLDRAVAGHAQQPRAAPRGERPAAGRPRRGGSPRSAAGP